MATLNGHPDKIMVNAQWGKSRKQMFWWIYWSQPNAKHCPRQDTREQAISIQKKTLDVPQLYQEKVQLIDEIMDWLGRTHNAT